MDKSVEIKKKLDQTKIKQIKGEVRWPKHVVPAADPDIKVRINAESAGVAATIRTGKPLGAIIAKPQLTTGQTGKIFPNIVKIADSLVMFAAQVVELQ